MMPIIPMMRPTIYMAAAVLLLPGCGSNAVSDSPGPSASLSTATSGQVTITRDLASAVWPSDSITITSHRLAGDTLVLQVQYRGGCRDHGFQLLAADAWMESYPVQVAGRLAHDAKGDSCKALVQRELRVSLAPLKEAYRSAYQASSGRIAYQLRGAGTVLYEF